MGRSVYSTSSDNTVRKIDSDGTLVWSDSMGQRGNDVRVDPDGFVYVARNVARLLVYENDGTRIINVSVGATSANALGVAAGPEGVPEITGYVGVSDTTTRKRTATVQLWSNSSHTNTVTGVCVDRHGDVYSVARGNVRKFDGTDGTLIWSYLTGTTPVLGKVEVFENRVVTSESGQVHVIDATTGNLLFLSDNPGGALDVLAIDNTGHFYAGSRNDEVTKFDSSGNIVFSSLLSPSGDIRGLAVDPDGFIYAGNRANNVHKLDNDGNEVWVFTGHTGDVNGVAVDPGQAEAFPSSWVGIAAFLGADPIVAAYLGGVAVTDLLIGG